MHRMEKRQRKKQRCQCDELDKATAEAEWRAGDGVRLSVTLLLLAIPIRSQSLRGAFRAVARADGVAGFRRAVCSRSEHQEKRQGSLSPATGRVDGGGVIPGRVADLVAALWLR